MIRKTIIAFALANATVAAAEEPAFKSVTPQTAAVEELQAAYEPLTQEETAALEEAGKTSFIWTLIGGVLIIGAAVLLVKGGMDAEEAYNTVIGAGG